MQSSESPLARRVCVCVCVLLACMNATALTEILSGVPFGRRACCLEIMSGC
jgi:hypothetical protein